MPRGGFTLTELLITVVIIAILAGVALPQYARTVERANWRAAHDVLDTIYSGEQVYSSIKDTFCDPRSTCVWRDIYMDDPDRDRLAYTVIATATTFTATATYDGGASQTVDENHAFGGGWALP